MPIRFTFLLLFSLVSPLFSGEKMHLGFEVLEGGSDYGDILQKKADALNKKDFDCRIVKHGERLSLLCNEISDIKDLAPAIEKFKREKISYTLVNLNDAGRKKSIGRQIPLYIGYRAYEQKNYDKALKIFRANYREKKSPEHAEAFSLALIKKGEYQKAITVLSPYADNKKIAGLYKESVVSYMDILSKKGDFTSAEKLIRQAKLSPAEKSVLNKKLLYMHAVALNRQKKYADSSTLLLSMKTNDKKRKELLIGNQMMLAAKALEAKKYTEAIKILEPYENESEKAAGFLQKIRYYGYLESGWKHLDKDPQKALKAFEKSCEIKNTDSCLEGRMYSYDKLNNTTEAIASAKELYERHQKDKYLKIIIRGYAREHNSKGAMHYYALLKDKKGVENPQKPQMTSLADQYLKAGRLKEAEEIIREIEDPAAKSSMYRYLTQMQKDRAMNILLGYSRQKDYFKCYSYAEELNKKYHDINIDRIGGWCAYHNETYDKAEEFFENAIKEGGKNEINDMYALALSAHKSNDDEYAGEVLRKITDYSGHTEQISLLYNAMGESRRAKEILLSDGNAPEYDSQIRAINKSTKSPNPLTQVSGGLSYYRNKGTEGKSYLEVVSLPLNMDYLSSNGYRLYGNFDLLHLSNGILGSADYRAFGFGNTLMPYYIGQADSAEGAIGFTNKFFQAEIGFTPAGLNLLPQPTGRIYAHYPWGRWDLHGVIEQQGIKESFLSYVGQSTDLDGQRYDWGRVLKRGVAAGLSYDGDTTYTFDLFYYPKIYGENVIENSETKAVATAIYHTASTQYAFLDFGAVIVYDSFENNSNLFTYGHGGYFSPQSFWLGSLVVDIGDYIGENTYYRFQGALGYQTYTVDAAEQFPLPPNPLYPSVEEGYDESGVTVKASLQLGHKINEHFSLSAGVSWEKMYGYDLLRSGIALSYYFDSQKRASLKRLRDAHKIDQLIP